MKLQVEQLSFSYDENKIIEDIHLHVTKGEFIGIIGPNGSGKSTVLKNLYRALKPDTGAMLLDGENLLKMNNRKAAQKIGVVGQENAVPFDFKVEEIVAMGLSPHKKLFDGDTPEDKEIVAKALAQTGMKEMAKRNYLHLSGGEKQRVLLARVLAQQTDFLLLDEPTNHLDIHYQLQMFDLIKGLGVTVLSAIHDLNIAALYCDRLYVLKDGRLQKAGTPEEILTPATIQEVYGIKADVRIHPVTKKISITYLPESLNL
ncbi:heme ABC transporter ATP-binding protein [Alkalihalobacillus oceani]|uniref:heme ABC transporter ATP-binding protein n=1 Tax=Halalkalibacter oceani TaxID=1653776 RepID=UPI00203CAFEE|nr:heme ABC transporter ATP-binding protein [Halalkalibacter oceani]MCM3760580.1 heme ABC transporter ATP-binding protein [Halalkalibacter oceani]